MTNLKNEVKTIAYHEYEDYNQEWKTEYIIIDNENYRLIDNNTSIEIFSQGSWSESSESVEGVFNTPIKNIIKIPNDNYILVKLNDETNKSMYGLLNTHYQYIGVIDRINSWNELTSNLKLNSVIINKIITMLKKIENCKKDIKTLKYLKKQLRKAC